MSPSVGPRTELGKGTAYAMCNLCKGWIELCPECLDTPAEFYCPHCDIICPNEESFI